MVVCFPGAKLEAITDRVETIVGTGKGGRKYRQLVRGAKQTWVEQIILSGILPEMGSRGQGYCEEAVWLNIVTGNSILTIIIIIECYYSNIILCMHCKVYYM